MITVAEIGKSIVEMNLPERVFESFNQAKNFLQSTTQQTKSLAADAQQAVNTITTAADKAVNTLSATAKGTLEQTLQKADQVSDFTSNAMQTTINNSVSEWLQTHPVVFRLVQLLIWATNHPIWGVVMLLFTLAIAWSLIKAISRLIETAWLFLLQAPFKLSRALFGVSAKSLGRFKSVVVKQVADTKTTPTEILQHSTESTQKNKQQRLVEISDRLEAMQNEQKELLQEVAVIVAIDNINIEI